MRLDFIGHPLRLIEREKEASIGDVDDSGAGKGVLKSVREADREEPVGAAPQQQHGLSESRQPGGHVKQLCGIHATQKLCGVAPGSSTGSPPTDKIQ
jgi:hypothetical protein